MWATSIPKTSESKKGQSGSVSLEKHVQATRDEFVQQRNDVSKLRTKIQELKEESKTLEQRFQTRKRKDIDVSIEELEKECKIRESMTREYEFEEMIGPYLQAYHQRVDVDENKEVPSRNLTVPGLGKKRETIDTYVQQYDITASRQCAVMNEYLMETSGEAPKLSFQTRDDCPLCQERMMLVSSKAIMTCTKCGYAAAYLDATMSSMSYSDEVEFSSFSYKRINHFNEWLQQVQAKENFEISKDILDAVMIELHKQRVTDINDITHKRVREVLKILKMRKAYEHVAQITAKLTGKSPMRIPPEAEEMCRLMFIAVQPAFDKHCPKDRKNFLSYSYCLYKFFQLLGYDEFLDSFTLLKGRDKLTRQDEIFKKICEELDWDFLPSV